MSMHCPTPNLSHAAEDFKDPPASGWGRSEAARQIKLLEEVVRLDRIDALIEERKSFDTGVGESRLHLLDVANQLEKLVDASILELCSDYAKSVVLGLRRSTQEIIESANASLNRLRALAKNLSLLNLSKAGLAGGLLKVTAAITDAAVRHLRLKTISAIACLRVPLFSYGPELSWFRHRLRLDLF